MNASEQQVQPLGKRERLVRAACRSYYRRGIPQSTLKVIAADADVPLGNVYYYFPTKDDLAEAAVRSLGSRLAEALIAYGTHPDPRERIAAFLDDCAGQAETAARYGCPVVEVASELHQVESSAAELAAEVVRSYRHWFVRQLQALPIEDALQTGEELFAGIQGAYAVSCATQDPEAFVQLLTRLRERIRQLPVA